MSLAERLSPRYKISTANEGFHGGTISARRQPKLNGRQINSLELIKYDAQGIRKTSPPKKKREWRARKSSSYQAEHWKVYCTQIT